MLPPNRHDLSLADASCASDGSCMCGASCSCGDQAHGGRSIAAASSVETTASIPATETFEVAGMTCSHCVASVREEIGRLSGVTAVDVELVVGGASRVTVVSAGVLDRNAVMGAVDEAGYELLARQP